MNIIGTVHESRVLKRRFRVLSEHLTKLIPSKVCVLDVGCGSGQIDRFILEHRKDIKIDGVDVLVREGAAIAVTEYDGNTLPCEDSSYDVVMFIDVLHHTENVHRLLEEAKRVSRKFVILKDHTLAGFLAKQRLNFMDKVGNRRFGVTLPYNYYTKSEWLDVFEKLGFSIDVWNPKLHLYPKSFSFVFDANLHFIARLKKN